jgi:hypothetical protein
MATINIKIMFCYCAAGDDPFARRDRGFGATESLSADKGRVIHSIACRTMGGKTQHKWRRPQLGTSPTPTKLPLWGLS